MRGKQKKTANVKELSRHSLEKDNKETLTYDDEGLYKAIIKKREKEHDNIIGMIAYCLFKHRKIEFIENRDPSDEELQTFYNTFTESAINELRKNAEASLLLFSNNLIEEKKPEIVKEFFLQNQQPKRWDFTKSVLLGLFINFLTAFIAYVIYLIVKAGFLGDFFTMSGTKQ